MERAQARGHQTPGLAQDPHQDRRDGGGSGNGPVDRIPDDGWKSGLPSSPPATSAMHPCCPSFSTRSRRIKRSPPSPPTAPSTPASAMTPSPPVALRRSYRPAGTQNPGNPTPPGLSHATRSCAPQSASGGPSGDDGAAITAEVAQRPRRTASSSWGSVCPPGTSTIRSRRSKSGLLC